MILFEIGNMYGKQQPYLEYMYKALFAIGYYGMLRVGELTCSPHVLKAKNFHLGRNKKKLMLILYSSKTHGEIHLRKLKSQPIALKEQEAILKNIFAL